MLGHRDLRVIARKICEGLGDFYSVGFRVDLPAYGPSQKDPSRSKQQDLDFESCPMQNPIGHHRDCETVALNPKH